ncbi:Predicted cell surface protein homologous to bacterial outer membrane proteins [Phaffia rhodozyma]|uniref:Predicted cell surface protein homologous to bacterial outer membrane proteins n=1 Tax=Phaffia rhodozyma TaxID=264483 RepID=A0A0F7SNX7_PHARH|nr:Predicted cell surface protein homologous to bacterial outer membrane proteins [Phaffia rhodozyma]
MDPQAGSSIFDDEDERSPFSSPQTPDPFPRIVREAPLPTDGEPVGLSTQEILDWQAQQRQARLQGEYQRSARLLNDIVYDNLQTNLPLASLRVLNTRQTRSTFLSSLLTPLLTARQPASEDPTLGSLLELTQEVKQALVPFGLFKRIDVRLEQAQSLLAREGAVDVVVDVEEAGRVTLKSGTEFGQAEGSAYITGDVRNVFGGAETLSVSSSVGTKTRSAFEASLKTPLFASPLQSLVLSVFSLDRDNTSYASHWEGLQGGKLTWEKRNFFGGHSITYEATQRTLQNLLPNASLSVREAARPGPSLKSSLMYAYASDTRDKTFLGTTGRLFKASQEIAGLGGSAFFLKSTTETTFSRAIGTEGLFASFSARAGAVLPMFKDRPVHLADRLLAGGPTGVRGFKMNGMGPRDGEDSLGGDLMYSIGVSLFSPLPIKPEWPFKLHAFANAGKLTSLGATPKESISPLFATAPSVSAGVGLVYDFSPVRIEANFTLPLVGSRKEGLSKGFSLGMGMDFL